MPPCATLCSHSAVNWGEKSQGGGQSRPGMRGPHSSRDKGCIYEVFMSVPCVRVVLDITIYALLKPVLIKLK